MLRRASVLARLHKRVHVSAAHRGSAGGGTLTRFFKVTQSRHIKKLHAHPSEAQFLNDVVTLKIFFKKKERNEKKRKSKVEPRHL